MLKLALIGCGRIAKRHSELLGLKQIKGAELAAVCDNFFDKAKKIGLLFDVPAYADMDEMMQNESIDVALNTSIDTKQSDQNIRGSVFQHFFQHSF